MPLVLVATPGATNANTYCTLAEADTYHESVIDNTSLAYWTAATDDQQNRALATATKLIDEQIEFDGAPTELTQALLWPRIGMYTAAGEEIDDDVIPQTLKDATAEQARMLLAADRSGDTSTDGISALKVGDLSIDFSSSTPPKRKVLSDRVIEMLALWGEATYRQTGTVSLSRA